jgi:hypothetical protein
VRREVAEIGLDCAERSDERGGHGFERSRFAGGKRAFSFGCGSRKLEGTDRPRRSYDPMGEFAGCGGIGLGQPPYLRHEFGRLDDEKIQKITLQQGVAAGLRGKMDAVEGPVVLAKIVHVASRMHGLIAKGRGPVAAPPARDAARPKRKSRLAIARFLLEIRDRIDAMSRPFRNLFAHGEGRVNDESKPSSTGGFNHLS